MADDGEIARRLLAAGLLHRPDLTPEGPPRVGPFEVLRVLSRGPRAEVLLAVAPPDGPVALKVPAGARRAGEDGEWKREVAALTRCAGPGVPRLVGSGTANGRPYLATEFVGARTLTGLALVDLVAAVEAAARACDRVHAAGLVHRAISPEHVLLGDGLPLTAWLTGLGQSVPIGERAQPDDQGGGLKVVRLASTAPEVLSGEPADPRNDVYALGALLHRGLTGELPSSGARGLPDPVPLVFKGDGRQAPPAPLLATARRALARRPDERFATAGAFADALRTWVGQAPPSTPTSPQSAWRALRAKLGGQ